MQDSKYIWQDKNLQDSQDSQDSSAERTIFIPLYYFIIPRAFIYLLGGVHPEEDVLENFAKFTGKHLR